MQKANPDIIESLDQSIFKSSYPVGGNILLLNFDELAKSDVIKHIPILSVFNALYKGVLGICDRFFLRKVVLFINQFNSGLSTLEIQKFVSDVLTDKKFRDKVNEKILILLDRFDDEFKALILAELLKSWVRGDIDWNTFQRLTNTVERCHPDVFKYLYDFHKAHSCGSDFMQLGMFPPNESSLIVCSGLGSIEHDTQLKIWSDALFLCNNALKVLLDDQYQKFPSELDQYLKDNREEVLNNCPFSWYERELLHWRIDMGVGLYQELRKDFANKIGACISEINRKKS